METLPSKKILLQYGFSLLLLSCSGGKILTGGGNRSISSDQLIGFKDPEIVFPYSPGVTFDGTWVFSSPRSDGLRSNIYRINTPKSTPEEHFPEDWQQRAVLFEEVNTPSDEVDPYISPDGVLLLFSSNRLESVRKKDLERTPSYDIYWAATVRGKWTPPTQVDTDINTWQDETCPSISADRKTLYFTRRESPEKPGTIYQATFEHGKFHNPEPLPSPINTNADEDCFRPAENLGGYLFQSRRSSSKGGWNIYYITKIRNRWGYPVEPFEGFNTDDQESYPLFFEGKVLYIKTKAKRPLPMRFASSILRSPSDAGDSPPAANAGKISEPEKIIERESNEEIVLSDRIAPVYRVHIRVKNEATGSPVKTGLRIDPGSGLGISGLHFSGETYFTDDAGELLLPVAPSVEKLQVTVAPSGFMPLFQTVDVIDSLYTGLNIQLRPVKKRESFDLHAIHFAYNSAELTPDSFPLLDSVAEYMKQNPEVRFEIIGHTDLKGSQVFNSKLSLKRAESVRDYLIETGIEKNRFEVTGAGKLFPLRNERSEEADLLNRRTEFRYLNE